MNTMQPIRFQCSQQIPRSAVEICSAVADTASWSSFKGYGILPGIASAVYEKRTAQMLGSIIRVQSSDGSTYIEEIYQWIDGERIAMKFHDFSPPLSSIATHFTEEWLLQSANGGTFVTRSFEMFPRHAGAWPMLWFISQFFRQAIERNLKEMALIGR